MRLALIACVSTHATSSSIVQNQHFAMLSIILLSVPVPEIIQDHQEFTVSKVIIEDKS